MIESASAQGSQTFRVVRQPDQVQKQIYIQMEAKSTRAGDRFSQTIAPSGPAPAPAAQALISDQVNDLAALRDQGHLSDAEFEAKKQELLDRM